MEDVELVGLAQAGDKEAFGTLIERYEPMAYRLATRLIANSEAARELVQEALLEAYLSLPHLREAPRFRSWLYGIVLNVCRNYRRNQKATLFSLESLVGGLAFEIYEFKNSPPDPQQIVEARELHRAVLDAVKGLSPRNRAATLLFYYDGLSLSEVATLLGLSVGAVKGRLHRARDELRTQLLPVYADNLPAETGQLPSKGLNKQIQQRSKTMLKVTILDVVPSRHDDAKTHYAVVLRDEIGQRLLPIWVGKYEGEAIGAGLRRLEAPRPLTFDFLSTILAAVGATLEEVRIETLKDSTFFATARIRLGQSHHEIDARPSDALALAVRNDCPILVAEEIFDQASLPVPTQSAGAGKGLDSMTQDWQIEQQKWQSLRDTQLDPAQANRQKLLDYLAGAAS